MFIRKNPTSLLSALKALKAGLEGPVLAVSPTLFADGKVTSLVDLQTELAGYITAFEAVEPAAAAHEKALQAREAVNAPAHARCMVIRNAVKTAIGAKSPDLQQFGIDPTKARTPLSTEEQQQRIAKARATRIARGTKGKRQRLAIKGKEPAPGPVTPAADTATHS